MSWLNVGKLEQVVVLSFEHPKKIDSTKEKMYIVFKFNNWICSNNL